MDLKENNIKQICQSLSSLQEQYEFVYACTIQEDDILNFAKTVSDIYKGDTVVGESVVKYCFKRLLTEPDNFNLLVVCCLLSSIVDEVIYFEIIQVYLKQNSYEDIATILTFKIFENEQLFASLNQSCKKKGVDVPFFKSETIETLYVNRSKYEISSPAKSSILITTDIIREIPLFENVDKKAEYVVTDMTNKQDSEFQKKIYLILKGSLSGDEAAHKLIKLKIKDEKLKFQAIDVLVKACSHEQSYSKYYGLIAEKLCQFHKSWCVALKDYFKDLYIIYIEDYESNHLRNVGKLYGHIFASDYIGFESFEIIHMNEEESTASNRIFVKFIFNELVSEIGIAELKARLNEPYILPYLKNMFPMEDADNMRFSINYFTAIKLGALTENMRKELSAKQAAEQPRTHPSRFNNSTTTIKRRRSLSPVRTSNKK